MGMMFLRLVYSCLTFSQLPLRDSPYSRKMSNRTSVMLNWFFNLFVRDEWKNDLNASRSLSSVQRAKRLMIVPNAGRFKIDTPK